MSNVNMVQVVDALKRAKESVSEAEGLVNALLGFSPFESMNDGNIPLGHVKKAYNKTKSNSLKRPPADSHLDDAGVRLLTKEIFALYEKAGKNWHRTAKLMGHVNTNHIKKKI